MPYLTLYWCGNPPLRTILHFECYLDEQGAYIDLSISRTIEDAPNDMTRAMPLSCSAKGFSIALSSDYATDMFAFHDTTVF